MAGPAGVLFVLGVVVAVVVVWSVARRRRAPGAGSHPEVLEVLRTARRRALLAVAFSATVFGVMFVAGLALPQLLGLPIALAPGLAGAAGLALYAGAPPRSMRTGSAERREASLVPRTPWSYPSKPALALWTALVAGCTAFLVFTGITSSPDERGWHRLIAFHSESHASAASPYPGWFYGVPLLLVTLILMLATGFALWRVSSTPAFPHGELTAVDERWRGVSARILVAISIAAVLVQFGGVSVFAGRSIHNALLRPGADAAWELLATASSLGGIGLVIGSVISMTVAALWSLSLPEVTADSDAGVAPEPASGAGTPP